MFLKIAQNVTKYFGYFWKKFVANKLSKIAQSGHTASDQSYLKIYFVGARN